MDMAADMSNVELIASPVTLPNGVVVRNSLVKAAMEEGIGLGGLPDARHRRLYKRWGNGGWGVIISGNVHYDPAHVATMHDLCLPDTPAALPAYAALAATVPPDTLLLMQLSHGGLQSSPTQGLCRAPWTPALAPVAARPQLESGLVAWLWSRMLWPRVSRIATVRDWLEVVEGFVRAAKVAEQAGWGGVQVHSAHGYLLAEYLSPLTNPHPSPLPGCPDEVPLRLQLLYLILTRIVQSTEHRFVKAVKVNCSDFAEGGLDEEQAANVVRAILSWRLVDMLEISGGNYSSPAFTQQPTSARQAMFAHFTTSLLPDLPAPPAGPAILLTGGLHSRALIASSLQTRACDLVGIARPACLHPALPRTVLLNPAVADDDADVGGYTIRGADHAEWLLSGLKGKGKIKLIGAGVGTWWHEWQMCRIGRGAEPDPDVAWWAALWSEWGRHGVLAPRALDQA